MNDKPALMALFPDKWLGRVAMTQSQTGMDGDMCPSAEIDSDPSLGVWREGRKLGGKWKLMQAETE